MSIPIGPHAPKHAAHSLVYAYVLLGAQSYISLKSNLRLPSHPRKRNLWVPLISANYSSLFKVFFRILASRKQRLQFFMKTMRHVSRWQWHKNLRCGQDIWIESSTTSLSNGLSETSFNLNTSVLSSIWPTTSLNNWAVPSFIAMSIIYLTRYPQHTAAGSHNSNQCYLNLKSTIQLCSPHFRHQSPTHMQRLRHAYAHAGHQSLAHCIDYGLPVSTNIMHSGVHLVFF
jgi:hypothetical protein